MSSERPACQNSGNLAAQLFPGANATSGIPECATAPVMFLAGLHRVKFSFFFCLYDPNPKCSDNYSSPWNAWYLNLQ